MCLTSGNAGLFAAAREAGVHGMLQKAASMAQEEEREWIKEAMEHLAEREADGSIKSTLKAEGVEEDDRRNVDAMVCCLSPRG